MEKLELKFYPNEEMNLTNNTVINKTEDGKYQISGVDIFNNQIGSKKNNIKTYNVLDNIFGENEQLEVDLLDIEKVTAKSGKVRIEAFIEL